MCYYTWVFTQEAIAIEMRQYIHNLPFLIVSGGHWLIYNVCQTNHAFLTLYTVYM
jgi:hypothetical protein